MSAALSHPLITDLRILLSERFTQPQTIDTPILSRKTIPTGVPEWDAQTEGLRLGEITEIFGNLGGTSLIMDALLESSARAGWLGAWVDAGDSLEVEDWPSAQLRRLLWVRCSGALTAMKAADLLLRDGNSSWIILDLQGVPPIELRRISGSHWHRFHRVVERQQNALVVLTSTPSVEGAKVRVVSQTEWTLDSLETARTDLRTHAAVQVFVRGRSTYWIQDRKTA